jgi:PAS domain S-box-containing protein
MPQPREPDRYALAPEVEAARLTSLAQLHLLRTREGRFAAITRTARVLLGVPMSAINLVDRDRQWCKQFSADSELDFDVPRVQSVCRATIARAYRESENPALVIGDLAETEFAQLPAVAGEGGVRFYAGFPLFGPGGHAVGTFCVYDTQPRRLDPRELVVFQELAAWAQQEIGRSDYLEAVEAAEDLLRASADSMLDPQVLLEAVRDGQGRVVDFRYLSANKAACTYLGFQRSDLVGHTQLENSPTLEGSELQRRYIQCVQDGEPVILQDYAFFNEILGDARRYDIQATRAGADRLSVTWRDVTERFETARRVTESERKYRLLAQNSSDAVLHSRDGRFAWVSPSIDKVLGGSPEYWLGRELREVVPADGQEAHNRRMAALAEGRSVQERIRLIGADGLLHWIHIHSAPFVDECGRQDGFAASLRLIDEEAAAEREVEVARRERVRADARFRRAMDNAAVGMCIIAPDGRLLEVNAAMCGLFGYDAETLMSKTWQELTAPEYLEADLSNVADVLAGRIDSYRMLKQYIGADGHRIWGDLSVGCLRDEKGQVETFVSQIADVTATREATQQYRLLAENAGDLVTHVRDGRFVWVSPSVREILGATPEHWIGREIRDVFLAEDSAALEAGLATLSGGGVIQRRVRVHAVDGSVHWTHLHAKPFYDAAGEPDGVTAALRLIDDEVAAQREAEEARRLQALADARYRRAMDTSAVGICMHAPDGTFLEVNPALCELFGYDGQTLMGKSWPEVTAPGYLEVGETEHQEVLAGTRDSYRVVKQYVHADGHRVWADVAVSAVRDDQGRVEMLATQIADITAEMEAREKLARSDAHNRELADRLQQQSYRLAAELHSAAGYIASILPRGMDGPVAVESRYLPSRELGGDSFDYTWLDDDHLLVYLIDVSGHGIEPALLSVSVHNLLRSRSLGALTLRDPEATLSELNELFQMDDQGAHYFTIWYGIYQPSSRTLRYITAGASPALAFTPGAEGGIEVTELATAATPVGLFRDVEFIASDFVVPPGCRILLVSDGAHELPLDHDRHLTFAGFTDLTSRLAASSSWSLDRLIKELKALTPDSDFEDDCSLIQLRVD